MTVTVAIPVEDGQVFQHFGKATRFRVYRIVDDVVQSSEDFEIGGVDHDEVALWLVTHEVGAVLCDTIGPGAQGALMAAGVIALVGVKGEADAAVAKLIDGTLEALRNIPNCGGHGGCGSTQCNGGCHCGHGGCCH